MKKLDKSDLVPKNFLNFFDRINAFIPDNIAEKVSAGKKHFPIGAYEVKCTYHEWLKEVLGIIDSMDNLSKKNKEKIKKIINADAHYFRNGGLAKDLPIHK